MIGVSLSHGQDPWTSKQKTVHLSLHKVALHLHVGPQQHGDGGVHIEQRSKQHVTSAQHTMISPRHPILGGRTIAALQQQQPETSVSMLQHPIASEKRWSSQDPCSRGDHTTEDLSTLSTPLESGRKSPKTSSEHLSSNLQCFEMVSRARDRQDKSSMSISKETMISERDDGHMEGLSVEGQGVTEA